MSGPIVRSGRKATDRPAPKAAAQESALGRMDRPGQDAAVRQRLSSVLVARVLGFRHRRPRRHGLPHGEHAVHGARFVRSDLGRSRDFGQQQGDVSELVDHQVRVPRVRRPAAAEPAPGTTARSGRARNISRKTRTSPRGRRKSPTAAASSSATRGSITAPAITAKRVISSSATPPTRRSSSRIRRATSRNGFGRSREASRPCRTSRNYASRLTKTILLGNLAVWAGTKVEWDSKALKATNLPDLDADDPSDVSRGIYARTV